MPNGRGHTGAQVLEEPSHWSCRKQTIHPGTQVQLVSVIGWLMNTTSWFMNGSRWSTMTSTTIEGSEKKLHQRTNHFQICFHRLPLSQCWFGLLGGFQATACSVRHGRWIRIHRCTNQKIQLFQLNGSWLDETWSGTVYPGLSIFDHLLSAFVFQPEFIRNDEEKWREYKASQSEKYCRLIWCKEQKREERKREMEKIESGTIHSGSLNSLRTPSWPKYWLPNPQSDE